MRSADSRIPDVMAVAAALLMLGALVRFGYHYVLYTSQMARFVWG